MTTETSYDARLDPEELKAELDCGCFMEWDEADPYGVTFTFCTDHRNLEIKPK